MGTRWVSFFTTDGSKIVVDSQQTLAYAEIRGETYVIDGRVAATKKAAKESQASAVHLAQLFVEEHGFGGSGKLSSQAEGSVCHRKKTTVGYAQFYLGVGEEILDAVEAELGVTHDSVWYSGSFEDIPDVTMSVYYVKNPVDNNDASRVVVNAGDITMVTDEKSNHAWQYNSDGEFTICYVQEMSKTNAMAKVSESTSVVVDNGVPVVRFNVGDARLLKISTIKFDAEARAERAHSLSK